MPKLEPVTNEELQTIMAPPIFKLWNTVTDSIDKLYDMDKVWDRGGKESKYVLRFRRGGKTLVSLFPKEKSIGLMVVYGKDEREKFENLKKSLSDDIVEGYESATTYHDGKWIMFYFPNDNVLTDLPALLSIKRKPNRK